MLKNVLKCASHIQIYCDNKTSYCNQNVMHWHLTDIERKPARLIRGLSFYYREGRQSIYGRTRIFCGDQGRTIYLSGPKGVPLFFEGQKRVTRIFWGSKRGDQNIFSFFSPTVRPELFHKANGGTRIFPDRQRGWIRIFYAWPSQLQHYFERKQLPQNT